jgi:deoxycytidine triphosphate deaminase
MGSSVAHTLANRNFAQTSEQAEEYFNEFRENDPLRDDVFPALLNGGDIYDYVRLTGMLFPFDREHLNVKLKCASYGIDFVGEVHEVDDHGNYTQVPIAKGTPFTLRKNSIAFVHLNTEFRLPTYIAARFNLQIEHVHRGLLLGTGPLVDPGFNGRLLIPLHNLTAEDYHMRGGDGLIWAEFTKVSRTRPDSLRMARLDGLYAPRKKSLRVYFQESSGQRPARSSIPEAVADATKSASQAKLYASALTAAGVIGIIALAVNFFSFVNNTKSFVSQSNSELRTMRRDLDAMDSRHVVTSKDAQIRLDALEARLQRLERATQP